MWEGAATAAGPLDKVQRWDILQGVERSSTAVISGLSDENPWQLGLSLYSWGFIQFISLMYFRFSFIDSILPPRENFKGMYFSILHLYVNLLFWPL